MDVHCQKTLSDLHGHLLLSTSLKPPYVLHPFSLPVILQILSLAAQLLTHPLENLYSFNFLLSFPGGYQIGKKYLITLLLKGSLSKAASHTLRSSSLSSKKSQLTHRLRSTTLYTHNLGYSFSEHRLTWSGLPGLLYGLAGGGRLREG